MSCFILRYERRRHLNPGTRVRARKDDVRILLRKNVLLSWHRTELYLTNSDDCPDASFFLSLLSFLTSTPLCAYVRPPTYPLIDCCFLGITSGRVPVIKEISALNELSNRVHYLSAFTDFSPPWSRLFISSLRIAAVTDKAWLAQNRPCNLWIMTFGFES